MKSTLSFLAFILFLSTITGQDINLNKYKYVIVNDKFDFVRQTDGYQTSSLTRFLFEKKGFEAFIENSEMPEDLKNNRCKALFADVKDDSGLLRTKLFIELKDCNGKVLYTSGIGSSKEKKYVKAYRVSIRQAFETISKMEYNYDSSLSSEPDKQISVEKEDTTKPVKIDKEPKIVVSDVEVKYNETHTAQTSSINKEELLYAQETNNGYQLVNTKPEVIFIILKTSNPEKFIIKDKNGNLVKSGDLWIAEYYEKEKLITKTYRIKF